MTKLLARLGFHNGQRILIGGALSLFWNGALYWIIDMIGAGPWVFLFMGVLAALALALAPFSPGKDDDDQHLGIGS